MEASPSKLHRARRDNTFVPRRDELGNAVTGWTLTRESGDAFSADPSDDALAFDPVHSGTSLDNSLCVLVEHEG